MGYSREARHCTTHSIVPYRYPCGDKRPYWTVYTGIGPTIIISCGCRCGRAEETRSTLFRGTIDGMRDRNRISR